jgi:hypothetical protein
VQQFMAERAKATVINAKSGHDVPAIAPQAVTEAISQAVQASTNGG